MGLDGVFPEFENKTFTAPHCDSSVLHAPGECMYCDHFPQRQADREAQRINFTGQADPDKAPCPSEAFRPVDTVHRWPGNRPSKVLDHDFVPPLEHHHGIASHMTAQDLGHLELSGPEHTEPGHTHDPYLPAPAVYEDACGQQFPPDTSFCGQPAWMHHDWTGMYGGVSQAQLEELARSVATKTSPKPTLTTEQRGPGQFHTHAPLEGQVPPATHVHAHVENDYPGHTHDGLQAQAAAYDAPPTADPHLHPDVPGPNQGCVSVHDDDDTALHGPPPNAWDEFGVAMVDLVDALVDRVYVLLDRIGAWIDRRRS